MAVNMARDLFFSKILERLRDGEDIVIVSADLGARVFDTIKKEFPERVVSVGIAEQNLISVSSGLALSGRKVIAYAAAPFIATRGFDQLRNLVSVMDVPLCIASIGAGFNLPEYGATHYVTEDLPLLRLCPTIKSFNISDLTLTDKLAVSDEIFNSPTYLRFDRLTDEEIFCDVELELGLRCLSEKKDSVLISTGKLGMETYEALKELAPFFIDIYSYPFDEEALIKLIEDCKRIVIVDECNSEGSLDTVILRLLARYGLLNKEVITKSIDFRKGLPKDFGNREFFLNRYGLDENLAPYFI